jgi:hypothetical protein
LSAARVELEFQAKASRSSGYPSVTPVRLPSDNTFTQRIDFCFVLRLVDQCGPFSWLGNRPWSEEFALLLISVQTAPKTSPAPFFGSFHQVRAQRTRPPGSTSRSMVFIAPDLSRQTEDVAPGTIDQQAVEHGLHAGNRERHEHQQTWRRLLMTKR